MTADPSGFVVRRFEEGDLPAALEALDGAFGGSHDESWFEWKHRQGPWGASPGWVAADDEGLIGLRLFLPWRFVGEGGRLLSAYRPCDTVTVERARGLGVFRTLTTRAMSEVGDEIDFYFNTPNENSRPGYLKMGYVEWTRLPQSVGVVFGRRARLAAPVVPEHPSGIRTALSDEFLTWRYARCPVYDYTVAGLAEADGPNGIVTRPREARGRRLLVVSELWGSPGEQAVLVRVAAREHGTSLVWAAGGSVPGAVFSRGRGHTVITRMDAAHPPSGPAEFSLGDVEDVV